MRASFDPAVEEFRGEVREYLRAAMAPERTEGHADAGDLTGLDEKFERTLQRDAGAHGYLALTLPAAYGGGERSTAYRAAFSLEAAAFDAPLIDTALTLGGAPILAYGSDEQRATLLPAMARGETTLCIAYSEADAGSDLTGIATTAQADDDGWRIDGTKVLVTGAHGFIGHALCKHLSAIGVPYVTAVRTPGANSQDGEAAVVGDLAAADWDEALAGVDSIVHLAGRAHVLHPRDAADHTPYLVANVHVTRRLCDAAVRMKRNQAQLYLNLAEVYATAGRRDEAVEALQAGLKFARRDVRLSIALNRLMQRREPVFSFLSRRHPVNRQLGRLRHRALQIFTRS